MLMAPAVYYYYCFYSVQRRQSKFMRVGRRSGGEQQKITQLKFAAVTCTRVSRLKGGFFFFTLHT